MQTKDVPDIPVLRFLDSLKSDVGTWFENDRELFENSVQHGMPPGRPPKIALSKMASLIKRGLVAGCACGCRGDFVLTDKGRAELTGQVALAIRH